MTAAELRDWQAEHDEDYASMGGLVTALAITFGTLASIAIYIALTI